MPRLPQVCPPLRGLLDSGVVEVQWQPPTDDLLDAYGERLLRTVQQRKVRRLFIDGLGRLPAGGRRASPVASETS